MGDLLLEGFGPQIFWYHHLEALPTNLLNVSNYQLSHTYILNFKILNLVYILLFSIHDCCLVTNFCSVTTLPFEKNVNKLEKVLVCSVYLTNVW